MSAITNIAAYHFGHLSDLKSLREQLRESCRGWELKGTILLSPEGINLFVAGTASKIDELLVELRNLPGFENLSPKISISAEQPFTRMLIRIKKEIIAFGVEGIDPATRTSPKLSAQTLKQWLDEGRAITLLDTRNDYEIKLGTFSGSRNLGISHFRQFPEAMKKLPNELKEQPVVMFCTGGIRCEKAGPFLEREGFQSVFQLEGGILKYFEECGGEHYQGECFVFDQRVGVDPALQETESLQCYSCQTPLTADEQRDPRYVRGLSCPYCFRSDHEQMLAKLPAREAAIRRATTPLPGAAASIQRRPVRVPARYDGATLGDCLSGIFPQRSPAFWRDLCEQGAFENRPSPDRIVRAGEEYVRLEASRPEPEVNAAISLLHEDEAIIVLNKPAPLPMHAGGRFHRNTLQNILNLAYAPASPRGVHRLDAGTTGLVVFARTRHFARLLQPQFEKRTVEKVYLARVLGSPEEMTFSCDLPIEREAGEGGARRIDEERGRLARTDFRVVRRDSDTSILEARPLTGRTNQIRIHLRHLGFPVCGDPAYLPDQRVGEFLTPGLGDAPLCLHAWKLSFDHPLTGKRMSFTAEWPEHFGAAGRPDQYRP